MNVLSLLETFPHRLKHLGIALRAGGKPFIAHVRGMPMYIYPGTAETCAYLCKPYEPYTSEVMENSVSNGATVLDIGAQFGYFSLLAAKRTGASGRVYAFEPAPANFELLKRNITLNRFETTVHPVASAVSDKQEMKTLYVYRGSDSHGMYRYPCALVKETISVPCIAIDEFLSGKQVDLIKMDIEGHEPGALRGMQKTIERSKRLIMICEFAPNYLRRAGMEPKAYIEQLQTLGLDVNVIDEKNHRLNPVTDDLFDPKPGTWYVNLYCRKR